jgi:hypothetical protein
LHVEYLRKEKLFSLDVEELTKTETTRPVADICGFDFSPDGRALALGVITYDPFVADNNKETTFN